jgi:putative transposase
MARLPRLTLAGYPHHVIQRGNNHQPIFASAADYKTLLDLLEESAKKFDVAVHAYVLMSNHFHLLATPQTEDGLPKMMQAVGRSYVRYFNDAQGRSGTLWEGRYKSSVIQSERYLLACMAYIDLNPLRAGLVAAPQDYPWSSHMPFAREAAYAELVQSGVNPVQQAALTDATLRGWALGEADFVADLQKRTTRRVSKTSAGRPFSVAK